MFPWLQWRIFFECYGFGSSKENINSKVFPRRKGGFCNECHARDTASALRIKNLQDICLGKPELNLFTVIFHKIIAWEFDDNMVIQNWLVFDVLITFSEWNNFIIQQENLKLQGKWKDFGKSCLNLAICIQKEVVKKENKEKVKEWEDDNLNGNQNIYGKMNVLKKW